MNLLFELIYFNQYMTVKAVVKYHILFVWGPRNESNKWLYAVSNKNQTNFKPASTYLLIM